MCYFKDFERTLADSQKGNFDNLMNSKHSFDYLKGRRAKGIRELDSRQQKETGYVKVYVEPTVVVEPPIEEKNDDTFEVIDLDAEMERRKKCTEANNPVQPDAPTLSKPLHMTTRSATSSPRRLVSQTQTRNGVRVEAEITGGNRAQRRAAKALVRKNAKAADKGKRSAIPGNSGSSPTTPKVVKLSDLDMGFRWE